MQPVKIGILGLGTVGGGTVEVLIKNSTEIAARTGRDIVIHSVANLDDKCLKKLKLSTVKFSKDVFDVINDSQIDIIVELIGGTDLAKKCVIGALEAGKHIVTANKALIAIHGNEIFSLAQKKGLTVSFEAAVAGGIPIIKAMREGLSANKILSIAGIINGTGNFILSKMAEENVKFADALKQAQDLGYAESDPTFDVEGIDAAHKLCIMSSIAFGIKLQFDKVYTEGISAIKPDDVKHAKQLGYVIKHLGIAKQDKNGVQMRVHPTLIPDNKLLSNVDGVMNAVLIQSDALGESLYYGAGAGAHPTASAVVADIIDVARVLTSDPKNRVPHLAFQPNKLQNTTILAIEQITSSYYINLQVIDEAGVLAQISKILSDKNISIEAVIQHDTKNPQPQVPLIILTRQVKERFMDEALTKIAKLSTVHSYNRIRCEQLGD